MSINVPTCSVTEVNAFQTCQTRHVSDSQKFFYESKLSPLKPGGWGGIKFNALDAQML
jgi:hypothetical protein